MCCVAGYCLLCFVMSFSVGATVLHNCCGTETSLRAFLHPHSLPCVRAEPTDSAYSHFHWLPVLTPWFIHLHFDVAAILFWCRFSVLHDWLAMKFKENNSYSAYFPHFGKMKGRLWDHLAVCASIRVWPSVCMPSPFNFFRRIKSKKSKAIPITGRGGL
jgi:hypothetical protein